MSVLVAVLLHVHFLKSYLSTRVVQKYRGKTYENQVKNRFDCYFQISIDMVKVSLWCVHLAAIIWLLKSDISTAQG